MRSASAKRPWPHRYQRTSPPLRSPVRRQPFPSDPTTNRTTLKDERPSPSMIEDDGRSSRFQEAISLGLLPRQVRNDVLTVGRNEGVLLAVDVVHVNLLEAKID